MAKFGTFKFNEALFGGEVDLTGVVVLQTVTPAVPLLRLASLSGDANLVTDTSDSIILNVLRLVGGEASLISVTGPIIKFGTFKFGQAAFGSGISQVLNVLRSLSGIASGVTVTPDITLQRLLTLSGAVGVSTETSDVALSLLKLLVSSASLESTTSAPVLLLLKLLAGIAALTTSTSTPNLLVQRLLAGIAVLNAVTSNPNLLIPVPPVPPSIVVEPVYVPGQLADYLKSKLGPNIYDLNELQLRAAVEAIPPATLPVQLKITVPPYEPLDKFLKAKLGADVFVFNPQKMKRVS